RGLQLACPRPERIGDVRKAIAGESCRQLLQELLCGGSTRRDLDLDVRVQFVELIGESLQDDLSFIALAGPPGDRHVCLWIELGRSLTAGAAGESGQGTDRNDGGDESDGSAV